ncbi:hypothetical protein CP980_33715 [Streptomyces vinaceus]|uniref:Uncharacterized protein n=1 Tax=Streptomyces vinaceus TaxID=1960 RepID=A0A5J6JEL3_STRVI|nr:hypothetical protein CP980_33715 [Streptomyces vinaceus]
MGLRRSGNSGHVAYLPGHFGPWKAAHNRVRIWAAGGTWVKVFTVIEADGLRASVLAAEGRPIPSNHPFSSAVWRDCAFGRPCSGPGFIADAAGPAARTSLGEIRERHFARL